MKQALLILSVLGMGIAQTSGAAVFNNTITNITAASNYNSTRSITPTSNNYGTNRNITATVNSGSTRSITPASNYGSTRNIYSTNSGAHVSNNNEISQAINALKQKSTELNSLSRSLYTERQAQVSSSVPDRYSAPAMAAARASSVALSRSSGRCARYVRKALQSAGYEFTPNPSAYQYATRGTLSGAGFSKIGNDMPIQVGDVIVYDRSSKHPHGHIQIFDGADWVSDFRQNSISPYGGTYSYTTWRDSQYVDDASNRGIYLAMADK